ncbi:MAG: radical SAM family heme chaperone HemW [Coriobacteriales bacterium]|nr:radical SAM family heme chaperone HemW [Coriobacteriales bacterium]
MGALYVHVPFCARKCVYCDFESTATAQDDPCMDAYLQRRLQEIQKAKELRLLSSCSTAYVGGGTPSFLGAKRLGTLASNIRVACPGLTEFTCEANPDSLTNEVLTVMADSGVTRLSIGVQSLDDAELKALGRIHTAEQAKDRVRAAVETGLDVSVDLMCAIPHQTDASWRRTLDGVLRLGVGHVSVYPLSIEEGTPLEMRYRGKPTPWNDDDVQAERMEDAERVLAQAGYERYEVASYARPGKQCLHNIAYWTGVPYLGLGPGAASMLGPEQYDLAKQVLSWLPVREPSAARMRFCIPRRSTSVQEVEFMSAREAWAEDLMLGMRLTQGIEATRLDCAPKTREDLLAKGLVARRGNCLVPTHDGWLLGNELYGALWDLAEPAHG